MQHEAALDDIEVVEGGELAGRKDAARHRERELHAARRLGEAQKGHALEEEALHRHRHLDLQRRRELAHDLGCLAAQLDVAHLRGRA